MPNAYESLGVDPAASDREVRAAYRRLARIYHPDRYATTTEDVRLEAQNRMAELNAAFAAIRTGRGADWFITPQPEPVLSNVSPEVHVERVRRETMFRKWDEAEKQAKRRTAEAHEAWMRGEQFDADEEEVDVSDDEEGPDPKSVGEAEEAQEYRKRVFAASEVWEQRNKRIDAEAREAVRRLRETAADQKHAVEADRAAWLKETGQRPGQRIKKKKRGLFRRKG